MTYTNAGNRSIIAISGKQLSGKDAVARLILELVPDFTRIGLGDAIKKEFARLNKITVEEVEQKKHIYRPDLIALGNKGRTLDNGLFWINKVLEVPGNIVIPDVRVKQEYYAFKENGAMLVRVEADRNIRAKRGILVKEDDPTECALDDIKDWDIVIYNNSDYDSLKQQVNKLCELIPKYSMK